VSTSELCGDETNDDGFGAGVGVVAGSFPSDAATPTLLHSTPAGRHATSARPAGGGPSASVDAAIVRTDLRALQAELLDLWADVVAGQPAYADHLRTAARFIQNAVIALDASLNAPASIPPVLAPSQHARDAPNGVIDLRTLEE
jgi:hypothetical protein